MTTIEVFSPVAETRTAHLPLAPRLDTLKNRTVALLDNSKANAGTLLRAIAEEITTQGIEIALVTAAKNATAAAPDPVMAHLRTCDAVVLAIAD